MKRNIKRSLDGKRGMFSICNYIKKFNKRHSKDSYSSNETSFFSSYTQSFSYDFGNDNTDFYNVEPKESRLKNLLVPSIYVNNGFQFELLLEGIAYNLLNDGKAYAGILFEYEGEEIVSIRIIPLEGKIKRKKNDIYVLYEYDYDGIIKATEIPLKTLIKLDLGDLIKDKKYFRKTVKALDNYDITNYFDMFNNNVEGYDFSLHKEYNNTAVLNATKKVGWLPVNPEITDSYYLYRLAKTKALKLKILNYIIKKINNGLSNCLEEDLGKIVINTKNTDYSWIWKEYCRGSITTKDLSDYLFNKNKL